MPRTVAGWIVVGAVPTAIVAAIAPLEQIATGEDILPVFHNVVSTQLKGMSFVHVQYTWESIVPLLKKRNPVQPLLSVASQLHGRQPFQEIGRTDC